jgi:hypothetical protein
MYFVLFRKSGLGSVNIPLAVLYFLIISLGPHCRLLNHQQRFGLLKLTRISGSYYLVPVLLSADSRSGTLPAIVDEVIE